MNALSVHIPPGATASASVTASGPAAPADKGSDHLRHPLGEALRAVRVMVGAAFEVIVLGRVDEDPGRQPTNRV